MKPVICMNSLKTETPYLEYDLGIYCKEILHNLTIEMPQNELYRKLVACAKLSKPKPKSFPDSYRLYVFDNRLNMLFHCLDSSGSIFERIIQFYRDTHDIADYCYGRAEEAFIMSLANDKWDKALLRGFYSDFGFLPFEDLAMPRFVACVEEKILEMPYLSQFQSSMILKKFNRYNQVDWKQLCDEYFQ